MKLPSSWFLLKNLVFPSVQKHLKPILIGISSMVIVALSTAFLARYFKPIIDDIFIAHKMDALAYVAFGVLATFIIKGLCEYSASYSLEKVGQSLIKELHEKIFSHLMTVELDFFRSRGEGEISSIFLNDIRILKNSVLQSFVGIVREMLTICALIYVMVQENPALSLGAFIGLPCVGLFLIMCSKKVRVLSNEIAESSTALTTFFQQIFQNMALVKASHAEEQEKKRLSYWIERLSTHVLGLTQIRSFAHPLIEILSGFAITGVIIAGGLQVINHTHSTGSFFAFVTALLLIYRPLKKILHMNTYLQEGLTSARRLHTILAIPSACEHLPLSAGLPPAPEVFQQDIFFDNVTFSYPSMDQILLKDFTCRLPARKKIAVVGLSGAGKSTLFNLLLRFYRPQKGCISLGYQPIDTLDVYDLRKNIAFVSQEMSLFDDTIAYNIAYGTHASLEQIQEAGILASADEFIHALPLGYHTRIGTQGIRLSGGQRQRIALARAFLRQSPILLLDEATSALDTHHEKKIQDAVNRLSQGRTTLFITHRTSLMANMDWIVVIHKGHLIQEGEPSVLMSQEGLYRQLSLFQKVSE